MTMNLGPGVTRPTEEGGVKGPFRTGISLRPFADRLTYVQNIKKPLLIGQGANDPRVTQAEADQIVGAMQKKNIPGHVRPVSRRGPRFCAVDESDVVLRRLGGIPVAVPGRALRTGR